MAASQSQLYHASNGRLISIPPWLLRNNTYLLLAGRIGEESKKQSRSFRSGFPSLSFSSCGFRLLVLHCVVVIAVQRLPQVFSVGGVLQKRVKLFLKHNHCPVRN